jgi:2-hydroxychromene-2-carboxylate isomerase
VSAFRTRGLSRQLCRGPRDLATETIAEILATLGQPPREVLQRAEAAENKQRLREQNQWAVVHGIFGAPTMIVGKELFWGDDRLEDAIAFHLRTERAGAK